MEDAKIVSLYLFRDETAISHTAEKYGSRLRAIAQQITGDSATAEECENDTYLEAWNQILPMSHGRIFWRFCQGLSGIFR